MKTDSMKVINIVPVHSVETCRRNGVIEDPRKKPLVRVS